MTYYGNMTSWGKVYKTLQALSSMTGFAAGNLTRDAVAIWNTAVARDNDAYRVKTYDGGAKSNIRNAYDNGSLTQNEAIKKLVDNGVVEDSDAAYWMIKNWDTDESKYAALRDAIASGNKTAVEDAKHELTQHGVEEKDVESNVRRTVGEIYRGEDPTISISRSSAIDMLTKYGGMDRNDAETRIEVYDWQGDGFDIDDSQTSVIKDYNEFCKPAGINKQTYFDAYKFYQTSGQPGVAYSKTVDCVKYINNLPLTSAQKTRLALCWWSESTVNKYKTW